MLYYIGFKMSSQVIEDVRPYITTLDQYNIAYHGDNHDYHSVPQSNSLLNEDGNWMLDLKIVEENHVILKDRHCSICKKW